MATAELVTRVWIEPGCIVCDACENAAPTVFHVTDDTCVIRPDALNAEFTKPLSVEIKEAAEECPVDVIKFEVVMGEAPAAAATPAAAKEEKAAVKGEVDEPVAAVAKKAPHKPAPVAKESAKEPGKVAAKSPEKSPTVSVAGAPDPAIQALLRAATSRGGMAVIGRSDAESGPTGKVWEKAAAADLPPDARQARVMKASGETKEGVTRRGVLSGSALGIGWLAFGGASVVSGVAFQRFMMPNVLEEPDPRVRIGKLEVYAAMPQGEVNNDHKPDGFWIIRLEDRIAALNIICTHLGCIPNWLANDRKFKCPCHGSGFRQTGINFEGPAPRPLERFRVEIVDGFVVVDRSKKYQYEKGQWESPESFIEV